MGAFHTTVYFVLNTYLPYPYVCMKCLYNISPVATHIFFPKSIWGKKCYKFFIKFSNVTLIYTIISNRMDATQFQPNNRLSESSVPYFPHTIARLTN